MAQLSWHVDARTDLDGILEFITRGSPEYAPLFIARIVRAAERLIDMPQRGRMVPEIGDGSYRELIFQNYRIVYRARSGRVIVIGVVYAAMDMERLAAERGWDIT